MVLREVYSKTQELEDIRVWQESGNPPFPAIPMPKWLLGNKR